MFAAAEMKSLEKSVSLLALNSGAFVICELESEVVSMELRVHQGWILSILGPFSLYPGRLACSPVVEVDLGPS